jgi:hypothetical protein
MNDLDKMDLAALEPEDAEHWHRLMAATLLRVDDVLANRMSSPLATIAGWSRPLLFAAVLAIALLVPAELVLETREAKAEQVERLVSLSSGFAHEQPPSSTDFLRALTTRNAR